MINTQFRCFVMQAHVNQAQRFVLQKRREENMASLAMHLAIAQEYCKKHKEVNFAEFVQGTYIVQ